MRHSLNLNADILEEKAVVFSFCIKMMEVSFKDNHRTPHIAMLMCVNQTESY
jgi:hypothetical protein